MDAEQQLYIRCRVSGREVADEVLKMARDEASILGPVSKQAFWERIKEEAESELLAITPLPAGPEIDGDTNQPMNDAQARAFGARIVSFGKHAGTRIDEVPFDYLTMFTDENEFKKKLRRYLASPRIKAELERP